MDFSNGINQISEQQISNYLFHFYTHHLAFKSFDLWSEKDIYNELFSEITEIFHSLDLQCIDLEVQNHLVDKEYSIFTDLVDSNLEYFRHHCVIRYRYLIDGKKHDYTTSLTDFFCSRIGYPREDTSNLNRWEKLIENEKNEFLLEQQKLKQKNGEDPRIYESERILPGDLPFPKTRVLRDEWTISPSLEKSLRKKEGSRMERFLAVNTESS